MATVVIMPRQGQSVESCIITSFGVKVGDTVAKGDVLFSYETDKSSFDELSPEEGKVLAIFREEGDDVPCLENVLVLGKDGEDVSAFIPKSEEAPAPAVEAAPAPAAPAAPGTAGQIKLYDTPDRDAAMIMAIVAHKLGKPLNELRFISIKEVK